jgi:O-antigen ligase
MGTVGQYAIVGNVGVVPAGTATTSLDRLALACVYGLVMAVPCEEAVPAIGGLVVTRWLGLAAFAVVLFRAAWSGVVRKISPLHTCMLALVTWSGATLIWSVAPSETVARLGTYAQVLVMALMIWEVAVTNDRILLLLQAYVFGTYIAAVMTIYDAVQAQANSTELERYAAGTFNENDLGILLALSIPMSLYLLSRRRTMPLLKALYWTHFPVCVLAILFSGSRGAVLAATVGSVSAVFMATRWSARQRAACLGIVASVALLLTYIVPSPVWDRVLSIGTEVTQGTLTHRTQIWNAAAEVAQMHPLIGVGAAAFPTSVASTLDVPFVAHNTFISIFVELGVIGALIFCMLMFGLFYSALRLPGLDRILWVFVLMTWVVGVSSVTWEYHKPTWVLFGLLAARAALPKSTDDGVEDRIRFFIPDTAL